MMGNIFNDDFREFIQCFNLANVKYILVGGYSVILHGYSRTTGDMDIWVERMMNATKAPFFLMTMDYKYGQFISTI
ncbi:MAG: hypothetical protein ACTHNW_00170 [Mucilaginibacter sp.]